MKATRGARGEPAAASPETTEIAGGAASIRRPAEVGLAWFLDFRLNAGPDASGPLLEALTLDPLWRELEVVRGSSQPGVPITSVDAVKQRLRDSRGMPTLGAARAATPASTATLASESDLSIEVGVAATRLVLRASMGGPVLDQLGPTAIDALLAFVFRLRRALRTEGIYVAEGVAWPNATGAFEVPRERPHRAAIGWESHGVVDVLEPGQPNTLIPGSREPSRLAAVRALAAAKPPQGVLRNEEDGLIVLRWVDDPRDFAALADAAGRHERWIAAHVETEPDPR